MIIKNQKKSFRKVLYLLIAGVIIVAIFAVINRDSLFGFIKLFSTSNINTTSKQPSAQSNFNGGKKREVVQTNKEEGVVVDSNGVILNIPPETDWTTSKDGVITVYSPFTNSTLKTGQSLSGKTSVPSISFRLIDNISGEIAQGKINVINGKFSAVFDFSTKATEGRLDVFVADKNGLESSVIEIPLRFN